MLIVQKFGGTSVADSQRLQAVAAIIARTVRRGCRVVAVVSAQGDSTDVLLKKALELGHPSPREMDALLSTGELISAPLLAMALMAQGIDAVSLTGWQAGLRTDGKHQDAKLIGFDPRRIRQALRHHQVAVVAGFQGIGPDGDVTTLGRGGSDTTAAALAVYLRADRCQIFTDVDGVYDKDPNLHPDAVKYAYLPYEEMDRLIQAGAQVLHDKCLDTARAHNLTLEVLSSLTGNPGTLVGPG